MEKGTITVTDGLVVLLEPEGQEAKAVAYESLPHTLKRIAIDHGWLLDGQLPPLPTEGIYKIAIRRA